MAVVVGAGNETTNRLIGWAGKVLADHPDQRREPGRRPRPHPPARSRTAALRTTRSARGATCDPRCRVPRADSCRRAAS